MNINQMHHFLDIAKTHSVNQSAANLYISPQGLSRSIAQFEKEIGLALFHRTNRGMTLTEEGQRLVGPARDVWEAYCVFERAIGDITAEKKRLGASYINLQVPPLLTVADLLPKILEKLREAMPDCRIDVSERNSFEMVEYAQNLTDVDAEHTLMVATVPDYCMPTYLPEDKFSITTLVDVPMVARVSKDHPLAQRKSVTRAELARERILCFNEPVIEDVIHHLLDDYGGPDFAFKGSIRNLIGRFPDAVSVSGSPFGMVLSDSIVSVPIEDTVRVGIIAIVVNPVSAELFKGIDCIAQALYESSKER